ncbi:MAG: hypothetical protein RMZ69_10725, partial [Nostoc sp. ChiQUE01a]|nr:hypothetical protein [Nostoc sp. ChiQUE01a]
GESSEADINRHATAEKATQSDFQKNFSTFTLKSDFDRLDAHLKLYHLNLTDFCNLKPAWLRY